jgi:hypothetical protein
MTDPIAELIDAAGETLRASMHIPATPEYPSDLYRRSGSLVDLLGKLTQVVGRLDDTLKHLPQTWELGSNDRSPASAHLTTASFTLRAAGAALDDAYRHSNERSLRALALEAALTGAHPSLVGSNDRYDDKLLHSAVPSAGADLGRRRPAAHPLAPPERFRSGSGRRPASGSASSPS